MIISTLSLDSGVLVAETLHMPIYGKGIAWEELTPVEGRALVEAIARHRARQEEEYKRQKTMSDHLNKNPLAEAPITNVPIKSALTGLNITQSRAW